MFSSDELLHFVFANDQDVYYCNSLLTLNLNQYLWLKLHEEGYSCVYFLTPSEEGLCVETFGDQCASPFAPESKFLAFSRIKSRHRALRKWMMDQLLAPQSSRAALIFSIKDFCEYLEADDWIGFLQQLGALERRSGILVLTAPPEAEGSMSYLLHSPVFDRIGDSCILSLRSARSCELYGAMYSSRPGRMLFLYVFTPERIHNLITRLFMELPRRAETCRHGQEIEDFLLQWLNNPELQQYLRGRGEALPPASGSFRDLFKWLQREGNWTWLQKQADLAANAGGIRRWIETLGLNWTEPAQEEVRMRRNAGSYAGRCLNLRLNAFCRSEAQDRQTVSELAGDIRRRVSAPMNRDENRKIVQAAEIYLTDLQAADLSGDYGTVQRLLFSIRFCLQWICTEPDSDEEVSILSVIAILQDYLKISAACYTAQLNYEMFRRNQTGGTNNKLREAQLQRLQTEAMTARRLLEQYDGVVSQEIAKLSLDSIASFSMLASQLNKKLSRLKDRTITELERVSAEEHWERLPEVDTEESPAPAPLPEEADDEEYSLNEMDFDIPPF